MIFGLKLFDGGTDCDETYSYNDTCAMHLAEYPEELKSYVCPMPRNAETEVVTHYNFKAYRKEEYITITEIWEKIVEKIYPTFGI